MKSVREISENNIGDNATIIQGDVNATFSTNPQEEERELNRLFLDKISKTDPFYDKKRILELNRPFLQESFEWILNHDDFQRWRDTKECGALWIKGDPGRGKTMLLCGIINNLENNPGINSDFCYFFCQATDNRLNTAVAAIGGLIFSLLKPRHKLLHDIRSKFTYEISQLSGPNAWHILSDMFEAITQHQTLPYVVCVVDALDECEHGVELLLSFITRTSCQVKWLFSSRNVKEIEQGLQSIDNSQRLVLELTRNAERISQSVDTYIDESTRDIVALKDDEELRTKTMNALKIKAEGTFLWVSLVVKQLRGTERRNIEEVLDKLPAGLENLYDHLLSRISQKLEEKDQNACHISLSIVTTAERPLRLEELLEFIKCQWEDWKENYDVSDMGDIVKGCGSFLSIQNGIVYPVHQSVKDYMVGKGATTIFPSGVQHQHSEMFKNSLNSMSCILTYDIYCIKTPATMRRAIPRPDPDPLAPIAYSCVFWVNHLIQSYLFEKSNVDDILKDDGTLHCFFRDKFLCWLEALVLLGQFSQGIDAFNKLKGLISKPRNFDNGQSNIKDLKYADGKKRDSCLDDSLKTFIGDAWKFINNCEHCVRQYPLQLYSAPFVFGDKDNRVNKTFQQTIHAKFGALPTLIYVPPIRFSHIQVIRPETSFPDFLLFSPDSSLLCIPQVNGTISLWETTSGTLEREIELCVDEQGMELYTQPGIDHHIAFSTDSNQIIFVSSEGIVQMWSIDDKTRVKRHRLQFSSRREKVIALSENGDLAASTTTGGSGQLIIWTTKLGDQAQTVQLENTPNYVRGTFSANSALIALIHNAGITIHSIQKRKAIQYLQRPSLNWSYPNFEHNMQAKFSPNGETLAYICDGLNIQLWCTTTWTKIQHVILEDHSLYVSTNQFAFTPDSSGFMMHTKEGLLVGDTATGQYQRCVLSPASAIAAGINVFSLSRSGANSSWLLATGGGGKVDIWLIDTADAFTDGQMIDFRSGHTVSLSPDSQLVAVMDYWTFDINLISTDSGEIVRTIKRDSSSQSKLAFSLDSYYCASQVVGTDDVHIWDVVTGTVIQKLEGPGYSRTAVAFSSDSKHLVIGYDKVAKPYQDHPKGLIRIWHVKTGRYLYEFSCEPSDHGIGAVAISNDLKSVAICDSGLEMQIWEPLSGLCAGKFEHCDASDVRFSSDSKYLATISLIEDEVQIWEIATGACLFSVCGGDPLAWFDPVTGDILTERFSFKNSSWENWRELPRQGYSSASLLDETWICLDGQKTLLIPYELRPPIRGPSILSNSYLMAFTSIADQVIIIKFPEYRDLEEQETKILGADSTSNPG